MHVYVQMRNYHFKKMPKNIQFLLSEVSKFMHNQGSIHWKQVSDTMYIGLFYPNGGTIFARFTCLFRVKLGWFL